jgi:hypothetical protein
MWAGSGGGKGMIVGSWASESEEWKGKMFS